ncbi:YcaO-like family protein [Amycolatopsis sp. H20-H5]|uniref:YcaO-like family protein n=1 Tax=Amycolatopsis sp. H20-H5 TaxID=3046309 RepID=UPI002DB9991B|nr:YcaO-like family protein [Amycolatopsis sp. H20-H5]MEC3980179.1 YcaO-like family protein [Amycolatopsis sp. H20-H5]
MNTSLRDDRTLSLRSRGLAEVERIAEGLLEPLGITRVSDVTGLDVLGVPVWHSVRPDAAPGLNTVTSGKGATSRAARVSAVMEAIERWCGEPQGRPSVTASYAELSADRLALDPRRLILKRSHEWTPDTQLTWWPTTELNRDLEVWVPALAIFTPFPPEANLLRSNTIGLAAGNDLDEAVLHALYEVVEHDCTSFAELLSIGHRVRLDTLPEQARELIAMFERASVTVTVHAYTNGIGIPTFSALTEDTHAQDAMLFNGGAGCHLDPEIAVTRAITEAAQSRLAVIGGAREDMDAQDYRRHASYDTVKDAIRRWSDAQPWCAFDDIRSATTGSVGGDLELVLKALARDGLDLALATELSPPDFPFSVAQVVVPGTEFAHLDPERVGVRLAKAQQQRTVRQEAS